MTPTSIFISPQRKKTVDGDQTIEFGGTTFVLTSNEEDANAAFLFPHFGKGAESEVFELKPRVKWSDEF